MSCLAVRILHLQNSTEIVVIPRVIVSIIMSICGERTSIYMYSLAIDPPLKLQLFDSSNARGRKIFVDEKKKGNRKKQKQNKNLSRNQTLFKGRGSQQVGHKMVQTHIQRKDKQIVRKRWVFRKSR